jgi:hypothetical protein
LRCADHRHAAQTGQVGAWVIRCAVKHRQLPSSGLRPVLFNGPGAFKPSGKVKRLLNVLLYLHPDLSSLPHVLAHLCRLPVDGTRERGLIPIEEFINELLEAV